MVVHPLTQSIHFGSGIVSRDLIFEFCFLAGCWWNFIFSENFMLGIMVLSGNGEQSFLWVSVVTFLNLKMHKQDNNLNQNRQTIAPGTKLAPT